MSSMDLVWYRNNLGSLEIYDCSMFMLDHINVIKMNDPKFRKWKRISVYTWMCLQNHLSSYGTVFRALSIHAI